MKVRQSIEYISELDDNRIVLLSYDGTKINTCYAYLTVQQLLEMADACTALYNRINPQPFTESPISEPIQQEEQVL